MNKLDNVAQLVRAGLSPRGLSRPLAAAYVGVSPCTFDALVRNGQMPRPRALMGRRAWDRVEIDRYFSRLPYDDGTQPSEADKGDVWSRVRV